MSRLLKLKNRILTDGEFQRVLADLAKRGKRSVESRQNRIIFRLACCSGLSPGEIAALQLRDVQVDSDRPVIEVCKARPRDGDVSRKARIIPLSIDAEHAKDITAWRELRDKQSQGDRLAPFLCSQRAPSFGKPISRNAISQKWKTAIRCLASERVRQLSIFCGRHTFIYRLLVAGVNIRKVQALAGHAALELTSTYQELLHEPEYVPDGNLFRTL
jgi:integrase